MNSNVKRMGYPFLFFQFLIVVASQTLLAVNQDPTIRNESDYLKYGMPESGKRGFWTEKENFRALEVVEKLAEINPEFLPSYGGGRGNKFFSRMIKPKNLQSSGPAGEKYFSELERIYLKYRGVDRARFRLNMRSIVAARLVFTTNEILSWSSTNVDVEDEVFTSLMAWSRVRFDLKSEYSSEFHQEIMETESQFTHIVKRMSPEFQKKVILKLDSIADSYPVVAKQRKIIPDYMEKLLKSVPNIRPTGMKFVMKPAKQADLKKEWLTSDFELAAHWLVRQTEIDKSDLPRKGSAFFTKLTSPETLKYFMRSEGDVQEPYMVALGARVSFGTFRNAYARGGVQNYSYELAALHQIAHLIVWEEIKEIREIKKLDAARNDVFINLRFNALVQHLCRLVLNDAAYARVHFPKEYLESFHASAIKYYPQAFRLHPEDVKIKSSSFFFEYKGNTESGLKSAKSPLREELLKQKKMMDQIESAIKSDLPKGVRGASK